MEHAVSGVCGQVAFVVVDETESPVLVTQTLPAELIRPADPGAPPS